jgi:hypothetical protein
LVVAGYLDSLGVMNDRRSWPMSTTPNEAKRHPLIAVAIATLLALTLISTVAWANWNWIVVQFAPKKQAAITRSEAALKADELFWQTFHNGEYEKIANTLEALIGTYVQTPNDSVTAAHIAWLHNWRISERARMESVPVTITDDMMLALLLDSIKAWPEFNLFTGGYVMSGLPAESPRFREGLEWQWRTLDECIEGTINRANPDYSGYMPKETKEGRKRPCWNSWIAPHNFEGFFVNMGDMLVKSGDWQTARKIYANAKLSKEYASWKYQTVLDDRIKQAQSNVALFNAPDETANTRIMINSKFSCTICHQQ